MLILLTFWVVCEAAGFSGQSEERVHTWHWLKVREQPHDDKGAGLTPEPELQLPSPN